MDGVIYQIRSVDNVPPRGRRPETDRLSADTLASQSTSNKSLGDPLECYDPENMECKSVNLPPEVIMLRRKNPLDPYLYRNNLELKEDSSNGSSFHTVEEYDYRHYRNNSYRSPGGEYEDYEILMWNEHVSVFDYIEREATNFEEKLKDFWYFMPKPEEEIPEDPDEDLLGYCDLYGMQLAYVRGVQEKLHYHMDIALKKESRALDEGETAVKVMDERCVMAEYHKKVEDEVYQVHEDGRIIKMIGDTPIILCDIGFTLARQLIQIVGISYSRDNSRYDIEDWEYLNEEWTSRIRSYYKMATKLVIHALPYLDGLLPSLLFISSEIIKQAKEYESVQSESEPVPQKTSKRKDLKPHVQMIGEMEDTVFGWALDFVNTLAKSICKKEEELRKEGRSNSEESRRNRNRARMIWLCFMGPIRREWERREVGLESIKISPKIQGKAECVIAEFVIQGISELIAKFAECKDTQFLLDMVRPGGCGPDLYLTLQMMVRPKKMMLGETTAKISRAMGLMCDHAFIYESPDYLMSMIISLRGLYIMACMKDIHTVNRSQAKCSVMWAVSKFWDVVSMAHHNEIIGNQQISKDIISQYATMFMIEEENGNPYGNYSFCRSLGGFYKWMPATILANRQVAEVVRVSLDKLSVQLCQSTDFKLRWNVAYSVGCCFGNENIFRAMEAYMLKTSLIPMCATIRRSQNFKERIQVLLAFGKLIRGNALKHSLGFILESICKSMVSLPHDTPAQHTHAKKFKVEAITTFCHIMSILEPIDMRILQDVLVTNMEHIRNLLEEIEYEIPESKLEILMKAYDRLSALTSRGVDRWPLVEQLTRNVLRQTVVDRGGAVRTGTGDDERIRRAAELMGGSGDAGFSYYPYHYFQR